MNTLIYQKAQKMKSLTYLSFPALLTFILLTGWQNVQANNATNQATPSNLVIDTLLYTEEAIALLRINPESSKTKIEQALTLIERIDSHYPHNTIASVEKKSPTTITYSHKHFYPQVDLSLLNSAHQLPTLTYKLKSNILYHGDTAKQPSADNLYFDYTFARASLKTAHEALDANHSLETMANLRRVFEAIYIDPNFNVSTENH